MRRWFLILLIAALSGAAIAQTNPLPPPVPLTDEQKKAKILEVCKQKADLSRVVPRDRSKYINECVDKAQHVD